MPVFIAIAANTERNKNDQTITSVPVAYSHCVQRAGAVPVILPPTVDAQAVAQMLSHVSGLILPGGLDMDAHFFDQEMHPACNASDPELDIFQIVLVNLAVELKMPILGICRGAQVANVALGGSLVQDIPSQVPESDIAHMQKMFSHGTDHDVRFDKNSRLCRLFGDSIRINSRHHQSIDAPGKGIRITAWAPDGVVEGAEHESLPIDLVQWHPELLMQKSDGMLPLFNRFIRNCQDRLKYTN
ncbi:MAG: gamma-glutamyl-gamma-aminobutyrate hydrolase family protein [Desulfobacter sp.]|jgi:putative glutamine amidotransferase|uniref:gamma-glutamyl-gamma-aminobutyrate hydrolase family protein n=1 Tax=uncultured Desulfobacter sp. TaxID=240139 RepID=UPI0029C7E98F|nr:gamma-glutamyl-gamma-aminobutyrate hydrolase family protein [uncultured Desulfobacter sp.]MCW8801345.1 gamma-glutamyl-gamma-aminobutyrate hydrolase family protein [Desulfobacter sp.]